MHRQISTIDKWVMKTLNDGIIVLDIESTGFSRDKDRIVEFAAIKLKGGRVIDKITFLVQSDKPIPWQATKVHGITNDMIKQGLTEKKAVENIINFIQGDFIIVGHNVKFDIDFIENTLRRQGYNFSCTYLDTLQLSRKYIRGRDSYSLGNLAEYYGFKAENMHRALVDVETTYKLLQEIIKVAK